MKKTSITHAAAFIVILSMAVTRCATPHKKVAPADFVRNASGVWVNTEYEGFKDGVSRKIAQKVVLAPDGTFEEYEFADSMKPANWGTYTVVESWMDREGYLFAKADFKESYGFTKELLKIHPSLDVIEANIVAAISGTEFPARVDPNVDFVKESYVIYYRR